MFYDYIKNYDKNYLLWLVCDATQKLTLEHHGYGEFWWQVYEEAVTQSQCTINHFTLFCAHRAALYTNKITICQKQNFDFATHSFQDFLETTKNTDEYIYYKTIYQSLTASSMSFDKNELKSLCENWFYYLSQPKSKSQFLIGEWQSFVTPFNKHKQAEIAVNSVINAFIYNDELILAKHLYQTARNSGLNKNSYIEKRLN